MKTLASARRWAIDRAFPLWSTTGFDARIGLFHERLDLERRPLAACPRRVMVQARQIASFSRASLVGWHRPGAEADALETVIRLYHKRDGAPGWIFSLHPDGSPASTVRDLYAHAFILYAIAWGYRAFGSPKLIALADETLADMDHIFAAPHGGFRDAVPAADDIRRQNPHMHLLEALLALHEATGAERYMARAEHLIALATDRFIAADGGALIEDFGHDWQPLEAAGENRVEPGHLFEWAWLLGEYARLGGSIDNGVRERLIAFATRTGLDPATGRIVDAVNERGTVLAASTRSWPHAEAVKAFAAAALGGTADAEHAADLVLGMLMQTFAPDRLEGGWIDRFDASGAPLVDHMPASTLYHISGAIREADRAFGSSPSG
ncbi:MAG TPA: AGE family epimerase/isomerase [Kaistia sp.]|nr:AGE family epimerase/isomerase [Kaistia sp.]